MATTGSRKWLILAVMCLALFVVAIDNTVLNVALPRISRDLGASTGDLQWIVDAYSLTFAGLLIAGGSLSDRYGRRRFLLFGLIIFGAASVGAAFAKSPDQLIAARAIMGVGGSLLMPGTLSILVQVFTGDERGKAIAIWSAVSALGVAFGPVLGGVLLNHFWWGSVFLINVPVVLIGVIGILTVVPEFRNAAAHRPDVLGAIMSMLAVAGFVYGIIGVPDHGWRSAHVLVPAVGGLVIGVLFLFWQRTTTTPMLDLSLLRKRTFVGASTSAALLVFGLTGSIFVFTQHLQLVSGYSPLRAAFAVLPVAGGVLLASPLAPLLSRIVGHRIAVSLGLLLIAVGLATVAYYAPGGGYVLVAVGLGILGFGVGLATAPTSDAMMSVVPADNAGMGSALNDTLQEFGAVLGVAIIGSVLASAYASHLPSGAPSAARASLGSALAVASQNGNQGGALAAAARTAFEHGLRTSLTVCAAVALAGAVAALILLPSRVELPAEDSPSLETPDPVLTTT